MVRISTWARYEAHGVMLPSTANRARRRKKDAESPTAWKRGWRQPERRGVVETVVLCARATAGAMAASTTMETWTWRRMRENARVLTHDRQPRAHRRTTFR